MELRPGQQLASVACETRVVVVRADRAGAVLTCGGAPMVPADDAGEPAGVAAGYEGPTTIGKRYTAEDGSLEVLCTKSGAGQLAADDEVLVVKGAKALPSSD